ncbi:MAG: plastocyanin/azurin family copper-binding protein [Rhodanobacteraceae bacterium]
MRIEKIIRLMTPSCDRCISWKEIVRHSIPVAATLSCGLAASSAQARDHVVTALSSPFRFEPPTLIIATGDTVTFVNGGGFHDVHSDDGSITAFRCANGCDGDGAGGDGSPSSDPWSATVNFPDAGIAPYHCEIHGSDGSGMHGTITVADGLIFVDGFDA